MADAHAHLSAAVNTVLGTVPADSLGVVAIHESLLSVVPGAQYAYDITLDQAAPTNHVTGIVALNTGGAIRTRRWRLCCGGRWRSCGGRATWA